MFERRHPGGDEKCFEFQLFQRSVWKKQKFGKGFEKIAVQIHVIMQELNIMLFSFCGRVLEGAFCPGNPRLSDCIPAYIAFYTVECGCLILIPAGGVKIIVLHIGLASFRGKTSFLPGPARGEYSRLSVLTT